MKSTPGITANDCVNQRTLVGIKAKTTRESDLWASTIIAAELQDERLKLWNSFICGGRNGV